MEFGIVDLLNLLGSLGLFLVGMKIMSDSLMELAGNRMRRFMAGVTSNRFTSMLTGLFITGLIQSSSSTTLMVVSFVNAGLLNLTEALGVIMGANIGTTLTAWLIAVLGFKVSMSDIALPLMIVGFLFYVRDDQQQRYLGGFIVGFALLFIGLDFMKNAVPDLQSSPQVFEFIQTVTGFGRWSLILFLVIGTLLTLVLQSSSATMAITLVAVSQGWLPFEAACAIVLGENVGTTITANLAAIVANSNARRAALSHMVFNIIGVIWVLLLFIPFIALVERIVISLPGSSGLMDATVGLAVFHTTFNVINTVVLIGFIGPIAALVTRIIPDREVVDTTTDEPIYLDENMLKYPETGIRALQDEARHLYQGPMYKVLMHGINLHRHDIEGSKSLPDLVYRSRAVISMDFEEFITRHVRPIYNAIVAFSTRLNQRFALEEPEQKQLRHITHAARDSLLIVNKMATYSRDINKYMNASSDAVRDVIDAQRMGIYELVKKLMELQQDEGDAVLDARLEDLRRWVKKQERNWFKDIGEGVSAGTISIEISADLYSMCNSYRAIARDLVRVAKNLGFARAHAEAPAPAPELADTGT